MDSQDYYQTFLQTGNQHRLDIIAAVDYLPPPSYEGLRLGHSDRDRLAEYGDDTPLEQVRHRISEPSTSFPIRAGSLNVSILVDSKLSADLNRDL
jgi:hypothetical protein